MTAPLVVIAGAFLLALFVAWALCRAAALGDRGITPASLSRRDYPDADSWTQRPSVRITRVPSRRVHVSPDDTLARESLDHDYWGL